MKLSINDGSKTYTTLEEMIEYANKHFTLLGDIVDFDLCYNTGDGWRMVVKYMQFSAHNDQSFYIPKSHTIFPDSVPRENVENLLTQIWDECVDNDEDVDYARMYDIVEEFKSEHQLVATTASPLQQLTFEERYKQ